MDLLSKIRRYLEVTPEPLASEKQARTFALDVFYARRNRERLAELLSAVITDWLGAPFGLGTGEHWHAQGVELMRELCNDFLDDELLSDAERERGLGAAQGPHTPGSLLRLLAATEAAISARRTAKARQQYEAQMLQHAA